MSRIISVKNEHKIVSGMVISMIMIFPLTAGYSFAVGDLSATVLSVGLALIFSFGVAHASISDYHDRIMEDEN